MLSQDIMCFREPCAVGQKPIQAGISDQELFDQLYALAQQNFPNQVQQAEAWLQEQLIKYGISRARYSAAQLGQTLLESPITWILGGMLVGWLLFKR